MSMKTHIKLLQKDLAIQEMPARVFLGSTLNCAKLCTMCKAQTLASAPKLHAINCLTERVAFTQHNRRRDAI